MGGAATLKGEKFSDLVVLKKGFIGLEGREEEALVVVGKNPVGATLVAGP